MYKRQYYTWNNGGGFVDDEGNWTLNSEQNVEAIQYAIDLVNSGYTNTDPANDTRYDLQDMFGAGKVAMLIAPNSLPTYIATGGNEVNYGVASIPSNTGESVSAGVMDRFMCFDNDYSDDEKAAISTFFDYFYDDARYTCLFYTSGNCKACHSQKPHPENWLWRISEAGSSVPGFCPVH